MGFLTVNNKEIETIVLEEFGNLENYLIALKHNTVGKSIAKTIISTLYRNIDSNREFILYFSENGIYEKELSFSDKAKFVLIPWNEIHDFIVEDKGDKLIIRVNHLDKNYDYEIPFDGKIMKGNRDRVLNLQDNNFYIQEE